VLAFAPLFVALVRTPARILAPIVITLCVIGIVAYRGSTYDLAIAAIAVPLGLGMIRYDYSRAALLLGFILAPFIETYGSIAYSAYGISFLWRPSVLVLIIALSALLIPWGAMSARHGVRR
jgi:TctA family transporter